MLEAGVVQSALNKGTDRMTLEKAHHFLSSYYKTPFTFSYLVEEFDVRSTYDELSTVPIVYSPPSSTYHSSVAGFGRSGTLIYAIMYPIYLLFDYIKIFIHYLVVQTLLRFHRGHHSRQKCGLCMSRETVLENRSDTYENINDIWTTLHFDKGTFDMQKKVNPEDEDTPLSDHLDNEELDAVDEFFEKKFINTIRLYDDQDKTLPCLSPSRFGWTVAYHFRDNAKDVSKITLGPHRYYSVFEAVDGQTKLAIHKALLHLRAVDIVDYEEFKKLVKMYYSSKRMSKLNNKSIFVVSDQEVYLVRILLTSGTALSLILAAVAGVLPVWDDNMRIKVISVILASLGGLIALLSFYVPHVYKQIYKYDVEVSGFLQRELPYYTTSRFTLEPGPAYLSRLQDALELTIVKNHSHCLRGTSDCSQKLFLTNTEATTFESNTPIPLYIINKFSLVTVSKDGEYLLSTSNGSPISLTSGHVDDNSLPGGKRARGNLENIGHTLGSSLTSYI